MAKAKDPEIVKENDETKAEIAEVVETESPEVLATPDAVDIEASVEASTKAKAKAEDEEDISDNENDSEEIRTTKAGKRSAKAQREAEAEAARLEAKEHHAENAEHDEPKARQRQLPNPLHQHGKKYRDAAKLVESGKPYGLDEALELVRKTATTKFDSSVELHINLGVDPRQADQMVRASVVLPHGTGKTIRIAVFAEGKPAEEATAAGADLVGTTELLSAIEKGKLDFDLLIATPAGMAQLGKVAKVLGPRGLMPNPKSGTVTPNVAQAVKEAKAGKVEFRIDKQGIIHQAVGKVSFSPENLRENVGTLLTAILRAKPSSTKGTYVKALSATSSMGPGIKIDAAATISAISTNRK